MGIKINGGEIILSGMVGGDAEADGWLFSTDGFRASDVIQALADLGRDANVVVHLNSGGGIATEGAAIHAALSQHKGTVQVIVEGVAASAASLLAMAADTLIMAPGSVMMVHDPAGLTFGTAADHAKTQEALNTLGDAYAGIYADRTGKSVEEMRAVMQAETWMTGPAAVEAGFADAVTTPDNDNQAEEVEPAAFAYGTYAHAPRHLVAMAEARGWRPRAILAASPPPQQEHEMTTKEVDQNFEAIRKDVEKLAEKSASDRAAEIVDICASAGVPAMASALIREGATAEQARARANAAGEIRTLVASAGKLNPAITAAMADDFIARGITVDGVRAALFDKVLAGQSQEVDPHVAAETKLSQRAQATASWDEFVKRQNERVEAEAGHRAPRH